MMIKLNYKTKILLGLKSIKHTKNLNDSKFIYFLRLNILLKSVTFYDNISYK